MRKTLLIILFPIFSYGQDTAKFCFTSHEMEYWINSAIDATTYHNVSDSLFNLVDSLQADKRDLRTKNAYADTLIQSQRDLSLAYATELQLRRKEVNREKILKKIFMVISGILGITTTYSYINGLMQN